MTDYAEDTTITIEAAEYDQMMDDLYFLQCLKACGLDNWQGYDDAVDLYKEDE